ncbi:MAG: molecular chaperone DjlA [Caulobacterales bacterium 32-69-10]|nr:MAG: molecular chaperone DjlA [Caulobacterales bacterium 32-69-10]
MSLLSILSRIAPRRAPVPASDCGCVDKDPDFSAALTALGAKLARADGRTDQIEYDSFVEAFPPEPRAAADVRRLYSLAEGTTLGFESYARRIGKRYGQCPEVLEKILDGLFHVARSDGAVTADELSYLQRVSDLVGLSPLRFRRLRGEHMGVAADDPYRVLDVAPDATDEIVRAAWKRGMIAHHPDKAVGRGLSAEGVAAEARRASAINAAFEAVMLERRAYLGAA